MANERDTTREGPSDAPDEPTAPISPGVRPAPSAGPGEYVGKAQPIDPARRRPPSEETSSGDEAPDSPAPGGQAPPDDAGSAQSPAPDDEPTGEQELSSRPPGRQPRTAPGRTSRRLRGPSNVSAVDRVRRAEFPVALRGYDRGAVDAYVAEMAQLVAELEATQLPETVVQRALDEVGDETSAILRQAHETSEEITARSRSQAAGRLQRAEQEAEGLRRRAEEQVRRVEEDIQSIWQERAQLLEELRRLADEVLGVADDALERIPVPEAVSGRASAGDDEATLTGGFGEDENDEDAGRELDTGASYGPPVGREPEDQSTAEQSTGSSRAGA